MREQQLDELQLRLRRGIDFDYNYPSRVFFA
jgi:hypothetical protein